MRFVKKILILIPFLTFFLMSQNASAVAVPSILTAQGYRQVNNGAWGTVTFFSNSTIPATIVNTTGLSQYALQSISASANTPNSQRGKYVQATLTGTLGYNIGVFNNRCNGITGKIRPEGVGVTAYNDSINCEVSGNGTVLNFQIYSYIELSSEFSPATFYFTLDNPSNFLFSCSNSAGASAIPCVSNYSLRITSLNIDWTNNKDPNTALLEQTIQQNQTMINQNTTIINQNDYQVQQDGQYYDANYEAVDNISGQNSSDIPNSSDQQTTNLIGIISSFLGELGSFQATSCTLTMPFPNFIGGNQNVNICQGKDVLGNFITLFSTLTALMFYIPLAWILLKMIYNEIRSWTNG